MRRKSQSARRRQAAWASPIIGMWMWLWIARPAVWREQPTLRWYVRVQFISTCESCSQRLAIPWLVYTLTHSSAPLALSLLAGYLPRSVLLLLVGGRLADRHPTRSIMLVSQTALAIQALALGILHTWLWLIYILQALASAFSGLNDPAEKKMIPQLIKREGQRSAALASNSTAQNLAQVAGTSLGGVIIGVWGDVGATTLFFANATSYVGILIYLFRLQVGRDVPQPETENRNAAFVSRGTTRGIIIKDIAGSPKVWLLFLITTITFLCNACGGLLQPLIGAKLGGVRGYTWLSVSNDIGCLLGSLVLLRLKKHTIQEQIALAAASSAFIVGVGLVGVVLPPNLLLAAVMLGAGCVTIQIQNTGTEILVQRYVPLHKLGRVGGHLEFIRTTGTAISIVCAGYMLIPTIGASVTNATLSGAALASFGGVEVLFIYLFYSGKLAKSSFNK